MRAIQRFLILCAVVSLSSLAVAAWAGPPQIRDQVPGYYRMQLGQFEVTALLDGLLDLDAGLLKKINPADTHALLARMFAGHPKMRTPVNAYLVNTGARLVLIDSGAGGFFGPNLGTLRRNMALAGYDPSQVDTVLVTHMHGDHIGGLVDAAGKPLFPNATIWASKADSDYWLSPEAAAAAPENWRRAFTLARDAAAPYLAAGKWKTFSAGTVIVPGMLAVEAAGHTPGHTAFAIESQGSRLFVWGDTVHAHAVQFARPGASIEFDTNQERAIATRARLFAEAARGGYLVAGMHLPFPGIGHVREDGEDTYAWVPVEFDVMPATGTQ